jgi:hypothetical protein
MKQGFRSTRVRTRQVFSFKQNNNIGIYLRHSWTISKRAKEKIYS